MEKNLATGLEILLLIHIHERYYTKILVFDQFSALLKKNWLYTQKTRQIKKISPQRVEMCFLRIFRSSIFSYNVSPQKAINQKQLFSSLFLPNLPPATKRVKCQLPDIIIQRLGIVSTKKYFYTLNGASFFIWPLH